MREDLIIRPHSYQGVPFWSIKDPVALQYYRLNERDFALLTVLDGTATFASIRQQFEAQFSNSRLTARALSGFCSQLHRAGLLRLNPREAYRADLPADKNGVAGLAKFGLKAISLRFWLFDPDRLLARLDQVLGWAISGKVLLVVLSAAAVATLITLVNFQAFQARLPAYHDLLGPGNWVGLLFALLGLKFFHELGHGLACKHFGGECHEMGLQLLGFTPCLYCDVTDSTIFANKWQRIAVGCAGIFVDLFLATLAAFLWWFTAEGTVNTYCMNVMLMGSIGTLIFNANPLLRFDGYYVLSDALEVPNLWSRSRALLFDALKACCWGQKNTEDLYLSPCKYWLLVGYGMASCLYRLFILLAFLWFLQLHLKPYNLQRLVYLLGGLFCCGVCFPSLCHFSSFLKRPDFLVVLSRGRCWITLGCAILLLSGCLCLPLPTFVYCDVEVSSSACMPVCVVTPGLLSEICAVSGDSVKQGERIAKLCNDEISLATAELTGQIQELQIATDASKLIDYRSGSDEVNDVRLESQLQSAKDRLQQLRRLAEQLTLTAPCDGKVVSPDYQWNTGQDATRLPNWSGYPLEGKNTNAYLSTGTTVCSVQSPDSLEIIVRIKDEDRSLVVAGQRVTFRLNQRPNRIWRGTVGTMSMRSVAPTERGEGHGHSHHARYVADRNRSQAYPATVTLDGITPDDENLFQVGTGSARIEVASSTIWGKLLRQLSQLFPFS